MLRCPPLRERVYRSHASIASAQSTQPARLRTGVYKEWSECQMDRALKAVVSEGLSVRRAALQFSVPRSSLGDRVSGWVIPGASSGPARYLTTAEENELVQFLTRSAAIGYAKSRKEVMALVQGVLDSKGIAKTVSSGWWESFSRRHPHLSLRTAAPLSLVRAQASDPDVISRYFDLLEQTLEENELIGKPGQIFNMDESGMPLNPKAPKVVAERGSNAVAVGSGDKSQVTIVGCVSAAGFCMPPMVIWDRKTLAPELTQGEVPGTIYGLSGKGWMDQELFDVWFTNHFLRYAPSARPILLLLDGHSSHYCPQTIRLAAQERVILFTLPPNTTHLSQPLDKGCFGPLKRAWSKVCHRFVTDNPGKIVTRYQFSALFSEAWLESMTVANITAGFRVTGVYPVNRNALSLPSAECESLTKQTGLVFIPLYSPASKRKSSREESATEREVVVEEFSEEEVARFETRYENGYDLTDDDRYNSWLRQYHPESAVWMEPLQYGSTAVSEYLHCPSPPVRIPTYKPKSCGRVLTSTENLALLEEKEKLKLEKQKAKKEREEARRKKAMGKSLPVAHAVRGGGDSVVQAVAVGDGKSVEHPGQVRSSRQVGSARKTSRVMPAGAATSTSQGSSHTSSKQTAGRKVTAVQSRGECVVQAVVAGGGENAEQPGQEESSGQVRSLGRVGRTSRVQVAMSTSRSSSHVNSKQAAGRKVAAVQSRGKSVVPVVIGGGENAEQPGELESAPNRLPTGDSSDCFAGNCTHPRARNWVQCGVCHLWFHCICVGVSTQRAKEESFEFYCCSTSTP